MGISHLFFSETKAKIFCMLLYVGVRSSRGLTPSQVRWCGCKCECVRGYVWALGQENQSAVAWCGQWESGNMDLATCKWHVSSRRGALRHTPGKERREAEDVPIRLSVRQGQVWSMRGDMRKRKERRKQHLESSVKAEQLLLLLHISTFTFSRKIYFVLSTLI